MEPMAGKNDVTELYSIHRSLRGATNNVASPALGRLQEAWRAVEALEASLQGGATRWQNESLFVAREGIRRAWLAISSVERGLSRQDR